MIGFVPAVRTATVAVEERVWRAFFFSLLVHGVVTAGLWLGPTRAPRIEPAEIVFELPNLPEPVKPALVTPPEETPPPPKPEEPVVSPPPPPSKPEVEKPQPPKDPPVVRKPVKPLQPVKRREVEVPESSEAAPLPMSAPPVISAPATTAPAEPVYRPVDVGAAVAGNPRPDYPRSARRLGQEGLVLLRVEVTSEGRAAQVTVERSSGFETLDQAAREAVARWRFVPAMRAGMAIAASVSVPIRFVLQER
ncbi:MAG: energy transducer TonB [Magnetococcus sp. YQC-9]